MMVQSYHDPLIDDTINLPAVEDHRPHHYFQVQNDVVDFRVAEIGLSAFAVYCFILRTAYNKVDCYPSKSKIAAALGITRDTVAKATATLIDAKMVRVEERFRPDGGRTSDRIIILDASRSSNDVPKISAPLPKKQAGVPAEKTGTPLPKISAPPAEKTGEHEEEGEKKKEEKKMPEMHASSEIDLIEFQKTLRRETKRTPRPTKNALPLDWTPTAEDRTYAKSVGLGDERIETTATKFRRYWIEKGEVSANWSMKWQSWVDNEVTFIAKAIQKQEADKAPVLPEPTKRRAPIW